MGYNYISKPSLQLCFQLKLQHGEIIISVVLSVYIYLSMPLSSFWFRWSIFVKGDPSLQISYKSIDNNKQSRVTWWRHQMEIFSSLLAICAGNSPVPGEFPTQRPVTRSFDVFFHLRLNKQWSKQSWGWWFDTLSRPLWRHCNEHV